MGTAQSTPQSDATLWYAQPAQKWEEALPIGSGRLGAMVFGDVSNERIQFNEDTLWTGKPHDYDRAGAIDHLKEVQQLVFDGKPEEAGKIFKASMISDPVRQKAYQPFGDFHLVFDHLENPTDYRRQLDLHTAIATTTFKVGDISYERQVFASYPDNAIVVHLSASQSGKVSFTFKLDSPHSESQTNAGGADSLVLTGRVHDKKDYSEEPGTPFESIARVVPTGGSMKIVDHSVVVENADAVTIVIVAATSFVNFQDVSGDPKSKCEQYLAALKDRNFETLKAAAVADHAKLFDRVSLDLGHSELEKLPTDERLKLARKAANPGSSNSKNATAPSAMQGGVDADPSLAALFFQYGRYMLITSSRPHSQAANLQGVWNEKLDPPWESKYTTNINLEMNYWPAETTNLSECADPLFDMIDDLRVSGAKTAKEMYGCRGWVLHHNTDIWRGTAPINNIDGMWPTGGAWLCSHLWEHYLFTGDKTFLEKRAYPAMKEASLFFVDFLVTDPKTGNLVTVPSFSPEQGTLCAGPAMDMQMIRALFDSTMAAAHELGNVDAELMKTIGEKRAKLVPDQIGKAGELQEWQDDLGQKDKGHRHMSPLWGLYPGAQFTSAMDPKMWAAVKELLAIRGDGSTGWSYAWRIPLWARIGDGEFAYRQLSLLIGKKTLSNMFDLCGPFQADGNFGAPAGMTEMLLQSHEVTTIDIANAKNVEAPLLRILPALPKAWPTGSVRGLRARGGFTVDLAWANRKLLSVAIRTEKGGTCCVDYGGQRQSYLFMPGDIVQLDADLKLSDADKKK